MKIKVLLFAYMREIVGANDIELELEAGSTGENLMERLEEIYPEIASHRKYLKLSMNGEYMNKADVMVEGAEIAVFPPCEWGLGDDMFKIVETKIDLDAVVARVSSPAAGAISTFIGLTRNYTGDERVKYLVYEAYHSMALQMMEKIGRLAKEKYDIEAISIVHRIGRVNIEEASVVIAVSAGHRGAAIEACHYAIDTLKEIVPIWKKEFMEDGDRKWIANRLSED